MKQKKINASCAFYVVSGKNTWGRGLELPEAFNAARIKCEDPKVNYVVTVFLFKEDTPPEIRKRILFELYYVDDFFGNVRCKGDAHGHSLTKEEQKLIDDHLIGWTVYNNINVFKDPNVKKKQTKS